MSPIKVLVQFEKDQVKPVLFKRMGRIYKISKVNLVYHFREGDRRIWQFFVSDAANSYKLRFEPDILAWFWEES